MSCEQLSFINGDIRTRISHDKFQDLVVVEVYAPNEFIDIKLDRNQAHLLKLWLEEHLK